MIKNLKSRYSRIERDKKVAVGFYSAVVLATVGMVVVHNKKTSGSFLKVQPDHIKAKVAKLNMGTDRNTTHIWLGPDEGIIKFTSTLVE